MIKLIVAALFCLAGSAKAQTLTTINENLWTTGNWQYFDTATTGYSVLGGSLTVQGNAFSVGGSTLAVSGGIVSVTANGNAPIQIRSKSDALTYNQITLNGKSAGGASGYTGLATDPANDPNLYVTAASSLSFVTGGGQRMQIITNGNVGIGTTSPGSSLEVDGSGIIVSSLTIGSYNIPGVWYSWTPNYTGFSANPTGACQYMKMGKTIFMSCDTATTPGTSNATSWSFSLPTQASGTVGAQHIICSGWNNGAFVSTPSVCRMTAGATTCVMLKDATSAAWTSSGTMGAICTGIYEAN